MKAAYNVKSKGWLKRLLATEPSIEMGILDGKDEPCYRLLGSNTQEINIAITCIAEVINLTIETIVL